jgi:Cd2+/Zn2+-exporting ATPase
VYGNASIAELEEAGAFDKLSIFPEKEKSIQVPKKSFWIRNWNIMTSVLFLLAGYLFSSEVFFAASIFIGGYSLFKTGLKNLLRLEFEMKTLMTIAIIGASVIGEWREGAVVVFLFAISEVLESYSMDKARASIHSLMELTPAEAIILRNGQEVSVKAEDIEVNDIMAVKPGQRIAMDGVVVEGISSVNQASITGESVPVETAVDDVVFAGTLNGEGYLKVRVTKLSEDTTIAKIIHLVEEAQGEKAPSQQFVDRFAKYYTPVIMAIAALVAILPPLLFNSSWHEWVYQGLAVLVVGCPCALVISTPVSIITAIGNAARNGVLIKGGSYLEEMGQLKAIAFDKTGTLTKGIPAVTDVINYSENDEWLSIVSALEQKSTHPLAASILKMTGTSDKEADQLVSVTGKGLKGVIDGVEYLVGNVKLFSSIPEEIKERIDLLQNQGKTVMIAGNQKEILGLIAVADEVRENSKKAIEEVRQLGIAHTVLLTGDNKQTAKAIGNQVVVASVEAELLPEEKLAFIKKLKGEFGRVAMVGDGVNDAPALASATIGIAMGGAGTDTALETADIAFMNDDLSKIPFTIKLSRKTLRIIKQNISFSIGIKILALLLVIPGWLTLWIAIFADMGTTLLVTLNGLRLLRVRQDRRE